MACYHPLVISYTTNTIIKKDGTLGTDIHIIKPTTINPNSWQPGMENYEYWLKLHKEIQERDKNEMKRQGKEWGFKLVPCGKCLGCRTNERQEWAIRIELECKNYAHNYFLTLTYDDEHIKIPKYMKNPSTGEIHYNNGFWQGTLVKKHAIQFVKSLRLYFQRNFNHTGMKFYYCGEYGDRGQRPHYHAILMNCPQLELKKIGKNLYTKHAYFTNERIEHIWGKGFITIGEVSWNSISYVAGYCNKKLFGEIKDEYYAKMGQEPIFANMSRRPGIGRTYFEKNKDEIYKYDEIVTGHKTRKPPSYFDRLMDIGEHDVMQEIKKHRECVAKNNLKLKITKTTRTIKDQLLVEEEYAKDRQLRYNRDRIKNNKPDLKINNIIPKLIT